MVLENMGRTCIVASMSEHLRFYGKGTNLRKLGEVNIVYSKIRAVVIRRCDREFGSIFLNRITYLREPGIWQDDKARSCRTRRDKQTEK